MPIQYENSIRDLLVKHGKMLLNKKKERHRFTNLKRANDFLNDLQNSPHAFVLACVMDRQIKAEKAWAIPYLIMKRSKKYSLKELSKLSQQEIERFMSKPPSLHRFNTKMSKYFYKAIQRIQHTYKGDAAGIWKGKLSSAEVVYRFLAFEGVGPKIANMAANVLARDFKIEFADHFSIDISADVHVRRVFSRLGLCEQDPTVEQVVYKARALHPRFPGILDLPCWEIGRKWCKPRTPMCKKCYMVKVCPTARKMKIAAS